MVIVGEEEDSDDNSPKEAASVSAKKALVSADIANLLLKAGDGSLGIVHLLICIDQWWEGTLVELLSLMRNVISNNFDFKQIANII